MKTEQFDFVVIGGGSAGLAVATRLSADPGTRVALIEAGGEADGFLVRLPAGFAQMLNDPAYDWCYLQDRDASIGGRRFVWSAGRMLGGSSSINGQVYIRATEADHARWVDAGCAGWSFADCLPYFTRAENFQGQPSPVHGRNGPISVVPLRDPHPLAQVFLDACAERGIPTLREYCGGNMDGAFLSLATQHKGWRCGTAQGYLPEARKRPNFAVFTNALVERLTFDGQRATGAIFVREGERRTIRASREVIVCAGAIGSPALLMRSGLGPAQHVRDQGIAVLLDRAAIGENLQEQPTVPINKFVNVPTYNSQMSRLHLLRHTANFYLFKKGPMATPAVQAMALARTRPDLAEPDVQFHFLPLSYDIEHETTCASTGSMPREPTAMISASVSRPKGRGAVRLRGPHATDPPQIAHQLLGDRRDVDTLIGACRLIESVFAAPAWQRYVTGPRDPARPDALDGQAWEDHVRTHATIAYHPVGSCRMGSDDDAVLDPCLRVRGIDGLRVADASVLPLMPSANTNATAIMIGERAADFILDPGQAR